MLEGADLHDLRMMEMGPFRTQRTPVIPPEDTRTRSTEPLSKAAPPGLEKKEALIFPSLWDQGD